MVVYGCYGDFVGWHGMVVDSDEARNRIFSIGGKKDGFSKTLSYSDERNSPNTKTRTDKRYSNEERFFISGKES